MFGRLGSSVRAIGALASAETISRAAGIVVIGVVSRLLTVEDLAILAVFEMLSALAPVAFGFGVLTISMKKLPALIIEHAPSAMRLARSVVYVSGFGVLAFCAFAYLWSGNLSTMMLDSDKYAEEIRFLTLAVAASGLSRSLAQIVLTAGKFNWLSAAQVAYSAVGLVAIVPLVNFYGVFGLAVGVLVRESAGLLLHFLMSVQLGLWKRVEGVPIVPLVREALPFYAESYLMYFRTHGDSWYVSQVLGPKILAIYFIAKRFHNIAFAGLSVIDKVCTRAIALRKNRPDSVARIVALLFEGFGCAFGPAFAMLICMLPWLIGLFVGEAYESAFVPAAILLIVVLVRLMTMPHGRALFVLMAPVERLKVSIVETVALFVLLAMASIHADGTTVAVSRLVAVCIAGFYSYMALRRVIAIKLNLWSVLKVWVVSAFSAFLFLGVQYQFPGPSSVFVGMLAAAASFLGLFWLLCQKDVLQVWSRLSSIR